MPTVLVVENDPDISSAIRETLTEEGWQVLIASSTEEAVVAVRSHEIDVVLCDLLLDDGGDGRVLESKLASMGRGNLPFGFMTASTRDIRTLGGRYALQKPFGTSQLLELLNDMLSDDARKRLPLDGRS